jgi:iron complex outermembrane receptor protein
MKRYLSGPATLSLAGALSMAALAAQAADAAADAPLQVAQAGAPPAAPAPGTPAPRSAAQPQPESLGAVVVTAQKREQKLEDVPVAVTAITSRQLETRGIQDIADLSALAPGLQIEESPSNRGVSQTAIRGNVQINPAIYWDTAVGVYLDGVFLGKAQGSVFDVVDLNRVEVLRGPQGTLYGRNTIGGAINLVTRAPTGEFGGWASAGGGNYGAHVEKLSLDLPKFSGLSLGFGAVSDQRDGWVKTTPGSSVDRLNNRGNSAFRAAANWSLGPAFQADYRFDLSNIEENNVFSQLSRFDNGPIPGLQPVLAPYISQQRQTTASIDGPSFMHVNTMGHSLTLAWNVDPDNTLKSITAYRHLSSRDAEDLDGTPIPLADTQRFTKYHQFSQELQWVGHADRWSYVGGLYYFHDDGFTNNPQTFFSGGANFDSRYGTRSDAWAPFGQVDYKLTQALTLTAGLRYTEELKALDRVFGCNAPATGCTPPPGQSFLYVIPDGSGHAIGRFEALTPSFTAAYRFNRNLNTYLRYAQGFKSGGFNGETDDPTEVNKPFKPEKQVTIELGVKSSFFDQRAELNAALFNNNVRNLQESIFTGKGSAASIIRNAGQATVRGIELEGAVTPVRGTRLSVNYAYLDAHYNSFDDNCDTATPPNCVQAKDNRAFVHAPRSTFNIVADSRFLRTEWGTFEAVADYAYTTGFFLYPYQMSPDSSAPGYDASKQFADNTHVKGYGLLNLRLALTQIPISSSAWGEVALWGRNVTDEAVATNKIDFGPGFNTLTAAYFNDPATYGITGTIHF